MVRKIVVILLVTASVMIALAALADPTIRYPYIGIKMGRDLEKLEGSDPIAVMLSVESGTELVSEEQLLEEPTLQDEFSLFVLLREELKVQKETASVRYEVEEMESEQWAWKEAKLKELKARTQVHPQALSSAPKLEYPKESVMTSSEVWTPLIASFWPKLPTGLQKAGKSKWQEQLSHQEKNPLNGEMTKVNFNLAYSLDGFVNTERGLLAKISVAGSILQGSEVDETVEVRGLIKGVILVEPETGRAYGGEYRIKENFMIRQPGLPVMRKTVYQGARFWRPMFYQMAKDKPSTDAPSELKGEDSPKETP